MRILIATTAVLAAGLALGACNVSKEGNAVTVQYDQNTAENTANATLGAESWRQHAVHPGLARLHDRRSPGRRHLNCLLAFCI